MITKITTINYFVTRLQIFSLSTKTLPLIEYNLYKIYQTLSHILNNTIKYSTENTITFTTATEKDKVKIIIADKGIGIPEE